MTVSSLLLLGILVLLCGYCCYCCYWVGLFVYLLRYFRSEPRRLFLTGLRDPRQLEGVRDFLMQQLHGTQAVPSAAAAAAPAAPAADHSSRIPQSSSSSSSGCLGANRAAKRQKQQRLQDQQQQQQQQHHEETEHPLSEESDSDGEGWDEEGRVSSSSFSLCVAELRQEPLRILLQQLQQQQQQQQRQLKGQQQQQGFPRLRHLQLDLVGIEWDNQLIDLLQSVSSSSY